MKMYKKHENKRMTAAKLTRKREKLTLPDLTEYPQQNIYIRRTIKCTKQLQKTTAQDLLLQGEKH
jgi:hypothetical protein